LEICREKNMNTRSRLTVVLAIVGLMMAAPLYAGDNDCETDYCINWWTISSGGVIESESDGWTLSGTIGQWEATEARALTGGQWRLTGGFWGLTLEELADLLFRDRFQDES
jgi:hypothetical protein